MMDEPQTTKEAPEDCPVGSRQHIVSTVLCLCVKCHTPQVDLDAAGIQYRRTFGPFNMAPEPAADTASQFKPFVCKPGPCMTPVDVSAADVLPLFQPTVKIGPGGLLPGQAPCAVHRVFPRSAACEDCGKDFIQITHDRERYEVDRSGAPVAWSNGDDEGDGAHWGGFGELVSALWAVLIALAFLGALVLAVFCACCVLMRVR